jgi:hypothetical protein
MGTKALCEMFSGHKHGDSGCDSAITMDSLDCEDAVWTRNHGDILSIMMGIRCQITSGELSGFPFRYSPLSILVNEPS